MAEATGLSLKLHAQHAFDSHDAQAIFTDYQLDKLSRDKAMREVYAEVTRQCKLSHPAVEGEMMNTALQEVRVNLDKVEVCVTWIGAGDKGGYSTFSFP